MNCTRFLPIVATIVTVGWIFGFASGMGQQASSDQGNRQANTEAIYKRSKDYVALAPEKKNEVHAMAMKFYGKTELAKFTANGIKEGHVGKGVIDFEAPDSTELYLDVDPCNATVEVFHDPYEKHKLDGTVRCKGKEYTYYSVEQKKKQK
jgi:hypothetical protein